TAKTFRNIGSVKSPLHLGSGVYAYRRSGRWRYQTPETVRQFGNKFIEATDGELITELASRGYQVLYPSHECVDRPNLPCPACKRDALRALGLALDRTIP
ncbi:MAG: hypothetical protein WBE31_18790, partial [Candidatus Sulfotelmatobacter sp.]